MVFTADARRIGLIEVADGGTLFLDEVAELPPFSRQTLRVLQERASSGWCLEETPIDVRIVTTSRDDAAGRNGTFRRDLFIELMSCELAFRLCVSEVMTLVY